jgi:hypothetical protein
MSKSIILASTLLFTLTTSAFANFAPTQFDLTVKAKSDTSQMEAKRSKKRVPGGSGCDSAHDRAEHPECRKKS